MRRDERGGDAAFGVNLSRVRRPALSPTAPFARPFPRHLSGPTGAGELVLFDVGADRACCRPGPSRSGHSLGQLAASSNATGQRIVIRSSGRPARSEPECRSMRPFKTPSSMATQVVVAQRVGEHGCKELGVTGFGSWKQVSVRLILRGPV